jgi:hypothetical protein
MNWRKLYNQIPPAQRSEEVLFLDRSSDKLDTENAVQLKTVGQMITEEPRLESAFSGLEKDRWCSFQVVKTIA